MKKMIRTLLLVAVVSCLLTVTALAVVSVDMAVVVGRGNVVVSNGLSAKLEPLSDGTEMEDMFCVPVVINESTYVPLRFVLEKMGITVSYDSDTKTTVLTKDNSRLPVYFADGKLSKCISVVIDGQNVTFVHGDGHETTEAIDIYKHIGMTYIPVRYLERFGALIKWDSQNSIAYISYEDTDSFTKKYERIMGLTNAEERQYSIDEHFSNIINVSSLKTVLDSYLTESSECFNSQNGGLVQPYNGKNYYPNLNIEKDGWFGKVGDNARQLCYATDGTNKYIYYVDREKQNLRRLKLETDDIVKDKPVKLPAALEGKMITHLTSYDGNLFFVAYDNAGEGGHVYMSRVGNEEMCTVKITQDKAWNYYVSPTYKLYFMNFNEGYRLTSIDMRSIDNINVFVNNPWSGVLSDIVNFTPMQSFAFDCQNATDYYYVDIVNGDLIKSSRNHDTGIEVLSAGKNGALRTFLNVGSVGGKKSVLYVEYPNGKNGVFDKCKIVQYDLVGKTAKVLHESSFAINGLCVYGGKIYFTDMNYSALYEVSLSGTEYKTAKIG